jgi:hypothetical protein
VGLYGDWRSASDSSLCDRHPGRLHQERLVGPCHDWLGCHRQNGCSVSLDGEYDGLDANFKVWTGNFRLTVPFEAQSMSSG